ncbi:aminotransferase class V-fold PLP-dependent enzyme [Amycolatopsis rhizosphaerae]|uniref:Aminotransferase class V-fold PLP-dependent enzyme n=1 Tax=Amycolatopsis rhizosphaerae TaxID=2053003 RepID=A0A558A419_9PSEU|nr:aminotransferase class V-fold PLP-dependent enzyme [Amycolatopsis rhizosphaerae]TVT19021.1 aminotransferase class V-fold PLP-dependent enzyme [Amycolatopsis rhizosphaerae]
MREVFGSRFDVPHGYLNTPSIGIPPEAAADAVAAAVTRWRTGAASPPDFDEAVAASRQGFADLIGVPADRIAIGASVSQLLAVVAAGLPRDAKVLTAAGEFTSVTFPFAARGLTVTEVPLDRLPEAVAEHDLVAVSAVQSSDGAVADLGAVRAAAEAAGVPVALDVTQAAGWLPLALDWADWVVAAGYKWLLSPRGSAWLAVHPRALEHGKPVHAGWYAGENPWDALYGLPLRLAAGARRFDLSPVWLAQIGAAAALPYLAALDREAVHRHCVGLAARLRTGLGLPARNSPIVSFDADPDRLAGAGIRASARAGKVRVGCHLYNTQSDIDRLLAAVG